VTPTHLQQLDTWLHLASDGEVEVFTGKVELGQGIGTALLRVVADASGLRIEQLRLMPVRTDRSPDEGYTAASASLETSGAWLRGAARALQREAIARAAALSGRPAGALELRPDGVVAVRGAAEPGADTWSLRQLFPEGLPALAIEPDERHGAPATPAPRGRHDLGAKIGGGAAYVHDLQLDGMLHARVLLPPRHGARLEPLGSVELPAGVTRLEGRGIVAVVGADEARVMRALQRLQSAATWQGGDAASAAAMWAQLGTGQSERIEVIDSLTRELSETAQRARYRKPYQAHAAMAPSCAVAQLTDGVLHVWTHSQGVYPLQRELCTLLELPPERLVVEHVAGPGCYGHNGADDVAAYAAYLATLRPGEPIRLAWTYEQEMTTAPMGPAMQVDLAADTDAEGRIVAWHAEIASDVHNTRPRGAGDGVMLAWHGGWTDGRPWTGPAESAHRNGVPPYDLPALRVGARFVRGPVRTSAHRTLGAFMNTFANESFIDELASRAGRDPVSYRLDHLSDPRMRAVLEAAVDASGWRPAPAPSGAGYGVAVSRYKSSKAFVAAVVRASVDVETGACRTHDVWLACDAGAVVDRDGLVNQLEGGAIQGISRALVEALPIDERGIAVANWLDYPVIGFDTVPNIRCVIVERPGESPLGAGEASTTPIAAAVANAIFDASGIRMRELPIDAAAVRERLFAMSDEELEGVIV